MHFELVFTKENSHFSLLIELDISALGYLLLCAVTYAEITSLNETFSE